MASKEEVNNLYVSTLYDTKSPDVIGAGHGKGGMLTQIQPVYDWISGLFPNSKFMGAYNNRNVRGGSTKSIHAFGRAFDIGDTPTNMAKMAELLRKVPGVQYVIYNKRISYKGGEWTTYQGVNPHTDHVHADFLPDFKGLGGTTPTTTGTSSGETQEGTTANVQSIGDNLLGRFQTFSWTLIPFMLGIMLLLLTLFSMFAAGKGKLIKKVIA